MLKKINGIVDWIDSYCERNSSFLFFLLTLFCCAYILWVSYFAGVYISPDSAFYLREAENLYHGFGFNYNGLAEGNDWFALFPIMYPFLICFVMKITLCNAYLASKILACICLFLLFYFIKRSTKCPFLFSPIILNFGFMWCSLITLSESVFILFVVLSVFSLSKFQIENAHNKKDALLAFVFSECCFLTRYYGFFLTILIFGFILYNFIMWIKQREKRNLRKVILLVVVDTFLAIFDILYFFMNDCMSGYGSGGKRFVFTENYFDLTLDLMRALLDEIYGLFGNFIHGLIVILGSPIMVDSVAVLIIAIIIVKFRKKICFRNLSALSKCFIIAGLVYYVVFIAYRYTSTMDHFYYRFFVPGTILFLIGLLNQLSISRVKKIHFAVGIYVLCLTFSYAVLGLTYYRGIGYKEFVRKWHNTYEMVDPRSVVLFSYANVGFEPIFMWIRNDVLLLNISDTVSLQDMLSLYSDRSIYLDSNLIRSDFVSKESLEKYHLDSVNIGGLKLLKR